MSTVTDLWNEFRQDPIFEVIDKFLENIARPKHELEQMNVHQSTLSILRFPTVLMWRYSIHPKECDFFALGCSLEVLEPAILQHIPLAENSFQERPRKAFMHINKAIALSRQPDASHLQARALCVRARMYFRMRAFNQCLRSLDLAEVANGRADLWVLASMPMRRLCNIAIEKMPNELAVQGNMWHDPYVFDRTFDTQQRQTWVQSTYDRGIQQRHRRVQFNRNIEAGRIIGIDRALFPSLAPSEDGLRCANCFDENVFELVPCSSQSACLTMFCSRKCRMEANNSWHKYECQLDNFLHMYPMCRPIVRLVCTTFRSVTNVREMQAFTLLRSQDRAAQYSVFAYAQMTVLPGMYQAKQAYALPTRKAKHDRATIFYFSRIATYVYKTLKHRTDMLKELFPSRKDRQWLRLFIYDCSVSLLECGRMQRAISSVRLHGHEEYVKRPMAYGLYPLSAAFEHSCQPNVAMYTSGLNEMVLCTVGVVRADQQLTIDKTLAGNNRHGHITTLTQKYQTQCNCPSAAQSTALLTEPPWPEWGTVMSTLWGRRTVQVLRFLAEIQRYAELNALSPPCSQMKSNLTCFSMCMERLLMGTMMRDDFVYDHWSETRRKHAMFRMKLITSTTAVMVQQLKSEEEAFKRLKQLQAKIMKKNRKLPTSEQNLRRQSVQDELMLVGDRCRDLVHAVLERRNTVPAHLVDTGPLPISESLVYGATLNSDSAGSGSLR